GAREPREGLVAGVSRGGLERSLARDADLEGDETKPALLGLGAYERDLVGRLRAQPVVHARHDEGEAQLRREAVHHVQQGHRVGAAGARDQHPLAAVEEPPLADRPSNLPEHRQNRPESSVSCVSRTSRSNPARDTVTAGMPSPSRPREYRSSPPPAATRPAPSGSSPGGT